MISYAIDRTSRRRRSLALATAALFVVSSIFPIAAGLTHDTSMYPSWWGITDVSLAFVLAIMAMAVQTTGQDRITSEVDAATTGALQLISGSLNDPTTGDFDLELPRAPWNPSRCCPTRSPRVWPLLNQRHAVRATP